MTSLGSCHPRPGSCVSMLMLRCAACVPLVEPDQPGRGLERLLCRLRHPQGLDSKRRSTLSANVAQASSAVKACSKPLETSNTNQRVSLTISCFFPPRLLGALAPLALCFRGLFTVAIMHSRAKVILRVVHVLPDAVWELHVAILAAVRGT